MLSRRRARWRLGPHLVRRATLSDEARRGFLVRVRRLIDTRAATSANLHAVLEDFPRRFPASTSPAVPRETREAYLGKRGLLLDGLKKGQRLLEEIGGYLAELSRDDPRPSDFERLEFLEDRLEEVHQLVARQLSTLADFTKGPRD